MGFRSKHGTEDRIHKGLCQDFDRKWHQLLWTVKDGLIPADTTETTEEAKGNKTMKDFLEIGSSPPDENCEQLGSPDYATKALAECERYIDVLRKKLGKEPEGARLRVKANPHDFGTYYEVVCDFDTELLESQDYAFKCDSNGPSTWDDTTPE